ncbi:hypothetical protein LCGC14_0756400 [marine sediment metagenome]|uniref:Uncharacterized protein n=1 Tax=marine sediment metagenome TaxID=412755 RepID=A0A0F9SMN8_9ZZZZ
MKKCLLMFGLLIIVLLIAVITNEKDDLNFNQKLVFAEDVNETSVVEVEQRDSIPYP